MAHTYRIAPEERLVYVTYTGRVDDDDLIEQRRRLREDPAFRPDYSAIIDFSGATEFTASAALIRSMGSAEIMVSPGARRAIVVPSDLIYGMMRIYQTLREPNPVEIFRDTSSAEEWVRDSVNPAKSQGR